ncbi:MAG: hypothetical protein IT236_10000, partial [Bacteroidia bacterium]|nr:hypothetical protein [Bacteroidia bacterium]
ALTPLNYANLANPVYSVLPGPLVNTSGTFVVSPTVTTTYTMFVTGTATNNAVATLSSVTTVTVLPSANVVVTTTQAGCGGANISSFSITATFLPIGQNPGYSVNWMPPPNVITSNQQLSGSGNISPGIYTFTLAVNGGCSAVESFTILGNNPANFIVTPYKTVMNCYSPTLNLHCIPNNLIYSTTNGSTTVLGPNPVLSGTSSVGVWTINANHPLINCPVSKTINVTQDFSQPSSQNAPLSQVINCTNTPLPFVSTISPTTGVFHEWYHPQGGVLTVQGYSSSYVPGMPGNYYHCAVKTDNGCRVCQTFTALGLNGFPTFSLQSPQNFKLGCSTKTVANVFIINGQTIHPEGLCCMVS